MTGIRRLRTAQDFIYSPDTINAAMDAMARDIASAVTGDSIAAENDDHDWKVVTGLQIYSEGDNDIAMTPGVAVGKAAGVPRMRTIRASTSCAWSSPRPESRRPSRAA